LQTQSPSVHVAPETSTTALPLQSVAVMQPPGGRQLPVDAPAGMVQVVSPDAPTRLLEGHPPTVFSELTVQGAVYWHWLLAEHAHVPIAHWQYVS
jgi:hypothetical protein